MRWATRREWCAGGRGGGQHFLKVLRSKLWLEVPLLRESPMGVGQLWRTPSSSTTALPRAFFVPSYSFTVALIFLHVRVVQFASAHPKPPLLNLPSPLSPWYCFTGRSTLAWWPTLLDFFIGEAHNSRLHLPSPIVVWPSGEVQDILSCRRLCIPLTIPLRTIRERVWIY